MQPLDAPEDPCFPLPAALAWADHSSLCFIFSCLFSPVCPCPRPLSALIRTPVMGLRTHSKSKVISSLDLKLKYICKGIFPRLSLQSQVLGVGTWAYVLGASVPPTSQRNIRVPGLPCGASIWRGHTWRSANPWDCLGANCLRQGCPSLSHLALILNRFC